MAKILMNAVQAAAAQWAGHMRRGVQLRSEKDFLGALALIPSLAEKKQTLVKTLRGLADLYAETGRLEDAVLLFERISQDAASPTRIFWCDYARLQLRLAQQQLREKAVAAASLSLEKVRSLAARAPGHAEMNSLCREGYLAIGTLFEQAGDSIPAELYFGRAVEIMPQLTEPDALQVFSELAWRAWWRRDYERCDHWALRASEAAPHLMHAKLGHPQARAAALLGALGSAAAQNHLPQACDHYFGWGEKIMREAGSACGVELADLLVAWASCTKNEAMAELRFQEALNLREAYLGEKHPKTRELRAALGQGEESAFQKGFDHPGAAAPQTRAAGPAFKISRAATPEELKGLQRRLIKLAHPDQAQADDEFELRNTMMREINQASKDGDGIRLVKLASSVRAELKRRGWLRSA